jgi:hypothetical protein
LGIRSLKRRAYLIEGWSKAFLSHARRGGGRAQDIRLDAYIKMGDCAGGMSSKSGVGAPSWSWHFGGARRVCMWSL